MDPKQLKGVFGFPVTPFRSDLTLDLDALARNVDEMTRHPFCAIVAAGGTGELYSMTPQEIEDVVGSRLRRHTAACLSLREPVTTRRSAPISRDASRKPGRISCLCCLLITRARPRQGCLNSMRPSVGLRGLPMMVYSRDWAVFSPEMVARLCDRVPTLKAWKDGQGNGRIYQRIMQFNGDRLAWFGGLGRRLRADVFRGWSAGIHVEHFKHLAKGVARALAEAGLARDFAKLDVLMKKYVHPLYAFRERVKGYEVAAVKTAMEMIGKPAGPVRPPLTNTRPQDVDDLRKIMELMRT